MSQTFKNAFISLRDAWASFGPFVLLGLVLIVLAYWWLDPTPPKTVRLATGPEQSAYDEFGKRYAALLKAKGIKVELVPSDGSSANLQLLREDKADIGFVQGGTNPLSDEDTVALSTLGSLFVEPIWFFYREDAAKAKLKGAELANLTQIAGWKISVGSEGSGVPNLMARLLDSNRLDAKSVTLVKLDQTPAAMALIGGEIDALVYAQAPESQLVQMLLLTPGIRLMNFSQSDAYARRFSFLSPAILPRGVVDLAADQPPADIRLVAPTTSLIAREGTHPALLQLFSDAAHQLHGKSGWFNKTAEFPNARRDELPLAKEAERRMRDGPPLLQRYLSFWVANLIERMWVAFGVIVGLLLPLSRILPPLYQFRVRSRVFKWYAQLRDIETRAHDETANKPELVKELNDMETKVENVNVPLSYADELYSLRNNIHLVRKRLLRA